MLVQKRKLIAGAVSLTLILSMTAGLTMAWFSDVEQAGSNFTAGVLNLSLNDQEGSAVQPLDLVGNVAPISDAQFQKMINDYVPGAENPMLRPVKIKSIGSLSSNVILSTERVAPVVGEMVPNLVDNGNGGIMVGTPDTIQCANDLDGQVKLLLFKEETGTLVPVYGIGNQQIDLSQDDYDIGLVASDFEATYVIATYLPSDTTNAYQGKHAHYSVVASATQSENAPVIGGGNFVDENKDLAGLNAVSVVR